MSEHHGEALQTALSYYEAWTSKDLELAMSYIADDIRCDAPAGRIEGAEAYRAFLEPFLQILKRAELLASFGDDRTAVLMYDTETVPVPSAPAAECFTVENRKITRSRFIFDRAPFQPTPQRAG